MNTVQSVFDIAIRLMDEQNEASGATDTADSKVYALRTPSLLNSLLDRCLPVSDTYRRSVDGSRPICPKVSAMDDQIQLDERLCTGVLPYGLAGLLLAEEDPGRADFFWQTFLEQLRWAAEGLPAVEESVEDVYGIVIEHGSFGAWTQS